MSYALRPYIVDLSQVAAVYASRDKHLLHAIVQAEKVALQEIRDLVDESYSPLEALKEIVFGNIAAEAKGEVHALVCELICKHLGQSPKAEEWQSLSMNWLMDINLSAALPIKAIPLPAVFPYVLTIRYADIENFVYLMGALDLEEEAWEEFEQWIDLAHQQKGTLVLFFY